MRLLARTVGLMAVLSLLAADAPQGPGDTLVVTRKTTKLRSQKRTFAPAVADLKEGDKIAFQKKEGAWLSVKFDKVTGWLHEGDVSAKADVRLSGDGMRESYSTSETSAARKGFNPQVEKQYRDSNPNLERAYQLVDQLQGRAVPEAEIRSFLVTGKLIREEQ